MDRVVLYTILLFHWRESGGDAGKKRQLFFVVVVVIQNNYSAYGAASVSR